MACSHPVALVLGNDLWSYTHGMECDMNDRELLELAAKAAEYKMHPETFIGDYWLKNGMVWNPLTDDGDALRLAVKLGINLDFLETMTGIRQVWANMDTEDYIENAGEDPYAATRRAIVRAAAEIGKTVP